MASNKPIPRRGLKYFILLARSLLSPIKYSVFYSPHKLTKKVYFLGTEAQKPSVPSRHRSLRVHTQLKLK